MHSNLPAPLSVSAPSLIHTSPRRRVNKATVRATLGSKTAVAALGKTKDNNIAKGQQTKQTIVNAALHIASQMGLEGLSIGALADATGMSKSGVFAHFGSREDLQIAVIEHYYHQFERDVFYPALSAPRGLPRLEAMFQRWMQQVADGAQSGCIFISGAVDFDDRPGAVRDVLATSVKAWLAALQRSIQMAKDEGHLPSLVNAAQMAFEIHGLILALHYEAKFLQNPDAVERARQGFTHVIERHKTTLLNPAKSNKL